MYIEAPIPEIINKSRNRTLIKLRNSSNT